MARVKPHRAAAPAQPWRLRSLTLGALPLLNHFLDRLQLDALLARYLPQRDRRLRLAPATALALLLRNILIGRAPVYALEEWAAPFDPALLHLTQAQMSVLNDDRVGRALDHLFDADRASFLTEVVVRAVQEFRVNLNELHNDSTTVTFSGEYRNAVQGRPRRGQRTLAITHGHNKDHRPDLKQLLWILTVSADGAVPVHYRAADGNTTDDQTHCHTWDSLHQLLGRADFLYVADSKLRTREALTYIAAQGGRFLTVLPRTRRDRIAGSGIGSGLTPRPGRRCAAHPIRDDTMGRQTSTASPTRPSAPPRATASWGCTARSKPSRITPPARRASRRVSSRLRPWRRACAHRAVGFAPAPP